MSHLHLKPRRRTRISARPQVEAMEPRMLLLTIVVTGTGDTIANDGIVTLREAITAANTNAVSGDAAAGDIGLDTIDFDIPGTGIQSITLATDLPTITEPIAIDGYSQPGAKPIRRWSETTPSYSFRARRVQCRWHSDRTRSRGRQQHGARARHQSLRGQLQFINWVCRHPD